MKATSLGLLSLSPEATQRLHSRGIESVESLSDLLHGSPDSQGAVAALLNLSAVELEALRTRVDSLVPNSGDQSRIGRLGVRPPGKSNED